MSPGRRLLPILKKMIAFETLLSRLNKKPHEASMVRAFVDEPGLDRELLKNRGGAQEGRGQCEENSRGGVS